MELLHKFYTKDENAECRIWCQPDMVPSMVPVYFLGDFVKIPVCYHSFERLVVPSERDWTRGGVVLATFAGELHGRPTAWPFLPMAARTSDGAFPHLAR